MKLTMIMTLVAATLALPVLATAGGKDKSASANDTPATYAQSEAFKSADANRDGFISKEEAVGTALAADFARLDTNGDGMLTQKEITSSKDLATSTDQPAASVQK